MTTAHDLPLEAVSALMEALNCGALLINREGVIIHGNERACALLDRPVADVIGKSLESFYPNPDDVAFIRHRVERFDEPYEGEFHVVTPAGERVPVIVSSRPLGDPSISIACYKVITFIDISTLKRAEARLTSDYREIARLSDTVLEQAIELKHHSERLEQKVRERTALLREANMEAIYMLAIASEAKDQDTGSHVLRIRDYTQLLARESGLPDGTAERFGYSAVLHDVGKMSVPDAILKKPGPLTAEERRMIERHTIEGERILSHKPFFDVARAIARSHHENWNGSGYPDGLQGEDIPLAARIVRLVDVYDALLSPRVYKPAWSHADAAAAVQKGCGELFDPVLVGVFNRIKDSRAFAEIRARG